MKGKDETHHHVLSEQALLLLQELLDTRRRQLPLPHHRWVLATVDEGVDIVLQLDQGLQQLNEGSSVLGLLNRIEKHFALLRSLCSDQTVIQVLNTLRGCNDGRQQRVLSVLEQLVSHLGGRSKPGRGDWHNIQEEHVGEIRWRDLRGGTGRTAMSAVEQSAELLLFLEEDANMRSDF